MSRNVRKRGRRRRRTRRRNWFTRMKAWQKVLICLAGVMICLLGSAVIYVAAQWGRIDRQEIRADDLIINQEVQEKNANIDLGEGYTNIALFGVDSRDGNLGEGNRTDMIIVASLNNETKEIKLVSVYRDTLLNLSEGTYQKCNAAYSYGGPTMAINMLNMNLDLDIEDYVTFDFGAISDVIDLLGGVEITIKEEELEAFNKYVTETARVAGKEANKIDEPGTYLMDGPQATTYARIRSTAGGDFTRTERQRVVIEKAVEKIQKADLLTINNIITEVFPQISTSFTLQEILYYAQAYSQYKLMENTGFPFDQTTDTVSGLGSIVIPQDLTENVSQLHEFLFGDTGYSPSSTVASISSTILATVDYSGSYDDGYDDYYDSSYDDGYDETYDSSYDDSYDEYDENSYEDTYDDSSDSYDESGDDTSYDESSEGTSTDDSYDEYDDTAGTSDTDESGEVY